MKATSAVSTVVAVIVGALMPLLTLACGPGSGGSNRFLSLGTGGTGGIYYPLGGAIASRLSVVDPDHQYTAEVTGGSVENVNRIAQGEMDIGFCMATSVFEAYFGEGDYAEPLAHLRVVAPLYPNLTHVLVPDNSTASSAADFRGRRVAVGAPGSGTEQLARQLLSAYGIEYDDIDVRYLSFRESVNALRDRAIDGAIISVGYPASAVLEVLTTGVARLLPVEIQYVEALRERYPYYTADTIPDGTYPRMDGAVPSVSVLNWLVATTDLDASVVRLLLDVLRDDRESLTRVNAMVAQIDLSTLREAPIPLHTSASSWLDETNDPQSQ